MMSRTMLVATVVCAALAVSVLGDGPSPVVVLTDSNFEHLTQAATGSTTGAWFVEFYAPWCGHCKSLMPEWERLGREVRADGIPASIAKVDCTENSATAHRFGIKGYPTLKLIADGKVYDYPASAEYPRTASAMKRFVSGGYTKTNSSPVPQPIGTLEMIWDFITTTLTDSMMMISRKPEVAAVLMGLGIVFGVIISILTYTLFTPAPAYGIPVSPAGAIVSGVPMQTMPAAAARTKKAE